MSEPPACICDPGTVDGYAYNQWIGDVFNDCIYTPLDQAAFGVTIVSMVAYLSSQWPQLWENYKRGSVEAVSLAFWLIWLFGDISNLLASLLTQQYASQRYLAISFMFIDFICLTQYAYYARKNRLPKFGADPESSIGMDKGKYAGAAAAVGTGAAMLGAQVVKASVEATLDIPSCNFIPNVSDELMLIGSILAWISGMLYFGSRFPQIHKNHQRGTVLGLSWPMFVLTVLANTTNGLSIIFRLPEIDTAFYTDRLPFIIGSIGTLFGDGIILGQFMYFNKFRKQTQSTLNEKSGR